MVENLNFSRPRDAIRVDAEDPDDVQFWSKRFGVSSYELTSAIHRVGTLVKDIERYLVNVAE